MVELDKLQNSVGEWSEENFGDQGAVYPLLGVGEETGELAEAYLDINDPPFRVGMALRLLRASGAMMHSVLKREQGIREDDDMVGEDFEREMLKHIALICERFPTIEPQDHKIVRKDDESCSDDMRDAIADIAIYQADLATRSGVNLNRQVDETWNNIVSEREWDSDIK